MRSGEPSNSACVGAARHLGDQAGERAVRELVALRRRHEPGHRATEHHHVVGRVRERGVAVAVQSPPEVGERVVGQRVLADPLDQALEALGVELVDHAVLAPEAAVEAHGGAAGRGRDPPHAERAGTFL